MRQFILAMGLHTVEELESDGFARYWDDSLRAVPDRGLFSDYWDRISSGGDITTSTPSYTLIREPMRRLCHRLIALTIAGRGQSPEKVTTLDLFLLRSMDEGLSVNIPHFLAHYLHRSAAGRDRRSHMTGGHFVSRLARHFGVIGAEIPAGLEVIVARLPVIDRDYLVRLGICQVAAGGHFWAALGPARAAGPEAEQGGPQGPPAAAPAHQEEPQAPVPPPVPVRTMGQRVDAVEGELRALRGIVDGMRRDSEWLVMSVSRLLEQQGITHTRPDGTHVAGVTLGYTRRVRPRTDDASTSGTHPHDHTDP